MEQLGRALVVFGLAVAGLGALVFALGRFFPNFRPGRLPGDIAIVKPGFSLYFPLTSMILLSLIVSLVVWFIGSLRK